MNKIFFVALCSIVFTCCNSKNDYEKIFKDPNLYCNTVHELNTVVMGNNFGPIVASRNYLYASIAGYEVIAAGYPEQYNSLAGQLHGLTSVPRPAKDQQIDFEFASLLAFCKLGEAVTFPEGSMKEYVDSLKNLASEHGMSTEVFDNSIAYSDTVSAAIMEWSKHDNYAQTRGAPEYNVNDSPGRWVPTPPAYAPAMEPHWREIRTLVIDSPRQFLPEPPYKFDVKDKTSNYYKEVKKIESK
ncbi:MAG TPA: hypothetical protein VKR32_11595, partial [Puia sp.]|nr:hypothetical protein [Puia sp.]